MERINALTIEQNRVLEKLTKMSSLLAEIGNKIQYFECLYLLDEKVKCWL